MNAGVISMRYARALLAFAKENGAETEVYVCMKNMLQAVEALRELPVLLRAPLLTGRERVRLICKVAGSSPLIERFAALVVKEQREELLPLIANSYVKRYCSDKSLLPVKFVTVQPLDDAVKEYIAKLISEKQNVSVELNNVIDPSIIGGYVYEAASRRIDASVSGQLREIRKQMVKQNRKLV